VREPIFILAAPHSLSSLLSAALGQHPEVYATPGLHLHGGALVGESIANARNEQPTQIHSLLRTIAHLYSSEQTVESVVMARRWLRRRDRLPSDEVYREICQKAAPRLVIERCPIQTGAATILHSMGTAFPSARFIYLVRHPFAQGKAALSDLQNTKKLIRDHRENNVESPELDPQFAWFETQITIFEFLETIPKERQWHLRVEDLVTEPSTVLSDLCSWLGVRIYSVACSLSRIHPFMDPVHLTPRPVTIQFSGPCHHGLPCRRNLHSKVNCPGERRLVSLRRRWN
jgi:hypothetical protein